MVIGQHENEKQYQTKQIHLPVHHPRPAIISTIRLTAKRLVEKSSLGIYSLESTGMISKRTSCSKLQEKAKTMLKMI